MVTLRSEFLFELNVALAPIQRIGQTPRGVRAIGPALSGSFAGPRLRGEVLPHSGADWLLVRADGVRELDVRVTLRTDDGQLIYTTYQGLNTITTEMAERLQRGEAVSPSEYYMRVSARFETGAPQYGWLNSILAVGVSERLGDSVRHTMFAIL